jgi:hypothetical protein
MPEKDETTVPLEHAMASLPIIAWQPHALIGPSLRLRPNLNTGYCSAVVPPALPLARTRN